MSLLLKHGKGEEFRHMECHEDQQTKNTRLSALEFMISGVAAIVEEDIGLIRKLFYTLTINSIEFVNEASEELGVVVDPVIALLNHSCRPNAYVTFRGPVTLIRAHRQIEPDETITISYISVRQRRPKRLEELQNRYFFECHCARCDEYPVLKDNFDIDVECYFCCKAPIGTTDSKDLQCIRCKKPLSMDIISASEIKAEEVLANKETMPMCTVLGSLSRMGHWSPRGHLLHTLNLEVKSDFIDRGNYGKAFDHSIVILRLPIDAGLMPDEVVNLASTFQLIIAISCDAGELAQSRTLKSLTQIQVAEFANYLGTILAKEVVFTHGKGPFVDTILERITMFQQDLALNLIGRQLLELSRGNETKYISSLGPMLETVLRNIDLFQSGS
ncbi:SET domain and MYND-type zinc finger protein 6 [Taphrina deformans PYCC 5710]|uniref:SET domain and MYND-type zinc finger protein 6 n=1 Tax=Taphrina deformans (strain PYCC 5710 / ATCC 11124 / CBS 356.35 / IMI 108563 / JCM 9778 / NBRC 8474) TaxID=1097556 RepID=R4XBQ3_TAPDE|nr:SET domain and MYND-type zinc finger protein 6 [Taphrina deformans PYCC 5710]|eukprot:CCG83295.1 SET domain and MYND-type zinc finger protein 6 [Taphrina deformans PYCC 5710]